MRSSRLTLLLVVVAATFLCLTCTEPEPTELPAAPHPTVVVAVDGLGADAVDDISSLVQLAAQSARFEWSFAQSTDPAGALTSLLTGLYPTTHGVLGAGDTLPPEAETLADRLSAAGLSTAAFGDTSALSEREILRGFDHLNDSAEGALQWLEDHADESFFLLIRTDGAGAGTIVEGLSAKLVAMGLDRKATVAVVGATGPAAQMGSLRGPAVRVGAVLRLPYGLHAGAYDQVVETIDLMPTLLALNGAEVPGSVQGQSLLPLIQGGGTPPYVAFSEARPDQAAVMMGGYQLVAPYPDVTVTEEAEAEETPDGEDEDAAETPIQLYHLADDPNAVRDLAAEEGDRVEVLQRHLDAWAKMVAVASLDPELRISEELDDDTLEQLKSLGYIQ